MLLTIGLLILGLVLLYFGAEGLVNGASSLALRLGITPLIVGLTVVSFGTSAPELLVCLLGTNDVSVGNIIGSNIANLALILGAAAMVRPIEVHARVVAREFPVMVAASLLFILLAIDGTLSRYDGIILLMGMAGYLIYTYFQAKKDMEALAALVGDGLDEVDVAKASPMADVAKLVLGIVGLAGGAKLMVDSAVEIAQHFGISELVIGISIVAIGTSLPELATSLVASYRNQSDISVGNVVGSNIFNIFLVLGVVAVVSDLTLSGDALGIDLWVMLAVSIGIWPLLRTGHRLHRWEGFLLIAVYIAYMVSLFLR
ncbi:MAG: calcium/sodium antiporter [Bradymonadaceae bacterium]|nr:calcium/sodium antiporter [Lujinxingiaceae bacterium]